MSPRTTAVGGIKIGTELNQTYIIDSVIGVGGMGEVFRGHNIQTGDPVAIKVVLPEYAKDEMILDLFRKEARILYHLSHEAIVRYHVFTLDRSIGRPYLAMEFVDGPSLAARLKDGPLPDDDVALLQRRLADGFQKAHEAGVIHRDMSPDNVILPDGQVSKAKIIDFGIARSANVGGATLLGGSFAGKYNWVAPEQLGLFGGEVTAKTDIYSLGLVLVAALTGHPIDMSGTQVEVIEKRRDVPDLSGVPSRFRGLLTAMLQPDPAGRPQSMAEVRDWKTDATSVPIAADDATVIRRPAPAAIPSAKVQASIAPKPSPQPETALRDLTTQPSGPSPAFAIVGALVAVIVLGVLAGLFFIDGGQAPQPSQTAETKPPEEPMQSEPEPVAPKPSASAQPKQQEASSPRPSEPEALPLPPQPEQQEASTPVTKPEPQTPAPTVQEVKPETPPPTPRPAVVGSELAAYVQDFDGGDCFRATVIDLTSNTANLMVFSGQSGTAAALQEGFAQKAGFAPDVTAHVVAQRQCGVVNALRSLSSPDAVPLQLVVASATGTAVGGKVVMEATVRSTGPRNVTLLMVTDDGAVQNVSRMCAKCISPSGDTLTIRLPLAKPPNSGGETAAKKPVLLLAVASPRNLFSISSQPIYDVDAMIPDLVKEVSGASDVATAIGYFEF
jgi:serine/threonine-protein kinase